MTRHPSLGALRRCRPTATASLNVCSAMSFSPCAVTSSSSLGLAPTRLSSPSFILPLTAVYARQLHFSPTPTRLSSTPQLKPEPEPDSHPESQPSPSTDLQTTTPTPDDLNPPPSTRPPPLSLPVRTPTTRTVTHLFRTGKAYLTFYKTGLRQIWTNIQLLRSLPSSPSSRSHILLRARTTHDTRRLPLFALLLLICGEFTPLAVLLLPQLVPFTCRIPQQVRKLRVAAEERRRVARQEGRWRRESGLGTAHRRGEDVPLAEEVEMPILARALGVVGGGWDRIGWVPGALARRRVTARWGFLVGDDEMLRRGDAVGVLVNEEVELACVDRGIDTVDRDVGVLRGALRRWLELTSGKGVSEEEKVRRMEWLVTHEEKEWRERWPTGGHV